MLDKEISDLLADGYALVGRVGYLDGFDLKARTDAAVERIDHAGWVQLVASRDAKEVVVRVEAPGTPSPRLLVLAHDPSLPAQLVVRSGGLYLGGAYRVVEAIDDPPQAEARWAETTSPGCWVSEPARRCC